MLLNVAGQGWQTIPHATTGDFLDFFEGQAGGANRVRLKVPDTLAADLDIDLTTLGTGQGVGFETVWPLVHEYGRFPSTGWWVGQTLYSPASTSAPQIPSGAVYDVEISAALELNATAPVPGSYGFTVNAFTSDVGSEGAVYQYANATPVTCTVSVTVWVQFVRVRCGVYGVVAGTSSVDPADPVELQLELARSGTSGQLRIAGGIDSTAPGVHDASGTTPGVNNLDVRGTVRLMVHP